MWRFGRLLVAISTRNSGVAQLTIAVFAIPSSGRFPELDVSSKEGVYSVTDDAINCTAVLV